MISLEDAPFTYEYDTYYKILPQLIDWDHHPDRVKNGKLVPANFSYSSDNNNDWMDIPTLKTWIKKHFKVLK